MWCKVRGQPSCVQPMQLHGLRAAGIRLEGPEDPHRRNSRFLRSRDHAHASIPLAQTPWGLTGRNLAASRGTAGGHGGLPPLK